MDTHVTPAFRLRGEVTVGGDKSVSHRALLLGGIASGTTEIVGLSTSADVYSTEKCMKNMGVSIHREHGVTKVHGLGLNGLSAPLSHLDAGNSGTTMRLLSGILAGQKFNSVISGDSSLTQRPMGRIITPLRKMGATIFGTDDNKAPLTIKGSHLNSIHYQSPVASAQVKSCVLLAGLYSDGITSVTEPGKSRDHTERMFTDFGIDLTEQDLTSSVTGGSDPLAAKIVVPGDISSAAFFMVAAAVIQESKLTLKSVGLNPTRNGILKALQEMGADIYIRENDLDQREPVGDITVCSSELRGIHIEKEQIPGLIDELPILAIAAVKAKGKTIVSGAEELRVKESDRLSAVTENLQAMGIEIEEKEDGFIIEGPQNFRGAEISTEHDHRIAMAFSIAGLMASGATIIKNSECVSVSMPHFFSILESIKR